MSLFTAQIKKEQTLTVTGLGCTTALDINMKQGPFRTQQKNTQRERNSWLPVSSISQETLAAKYVIQLYRTRM